MTLCLFAAGCEEDPDMFLHVHRESTEQNFDLAVCAHGAAIDDISCLKRFTPIFDSPSEGLNRTVGIYVTDESEAVRHIWRLADFSWCEWVDVVVQPGGTTFTVKLPADTSKPLILEDCPPDVCTGPKPMCDGLVKLTRGATSGSALRAHTRAASTVVEPVGFRRRRH